MQKLVQGIHQFQASIFRSKAELFQGLAKGQDPTAFFITCSDSRINPNLITQTEPGDLFLMRNVGNLVPPYGATTGGEDAAIEYAVEGLKIRDIIVCGHTGCGAMHGLLNPDQIKTMPRVASWLRHAEATKRIVDQLYPDLTGDDRLTATAEENVLVQLENLRTHPVVAAALAAGRLSLHAWMYKIATGQVFTYDPLRGQFIDVAEQGPDAEVAARRTAARIADLEAESARHAGNGSPAPAAESVNH
jgi:carbonic anhydrase